MNIVMLDNSVPYDGFTSLSRPLGGAQKAFASLAGSLAKSGNRVTVLNRCKHALMADGARWRPIGNDIPQDVDLVIALRDPALFELLPRADTRVLWVVDDPKYLGSIKNSNLLSTYAPRLMFLTNRQANEYGGRLSSVVVSPGVNRSFINYSDSDNVIHDPNHSLDTLGDFSEDSENDIEIPPPVAVVTTHPMYGLSNLLRIWKDSIYPKNNNAELKVFSNVLFRAVEGKNIPGEMKSIVNLCLECSKCNVNILAPRGDREMAKEYQNARVHFYQSNKLDYSCWTLRDSQASNLPAIAKPAGGVEDIIINSTTGYIVPDDEAFINVSLRLLSDDSFYFSLKEGCVNNESLGSWEKTAEAVAQIWI